MTQNKDLKDPNLLFENRAKKMLARIQVLRNDLRNVNHYFSKAIIETELERLEDDYIERSLILQRNSQERSAEKTTDRN